MRPVVEVKFVTRTAMELYELKTTNPGAVCPIVIGRFPLVNKIEPSFSTLTFTFGPKLSVCMKRIHWPAALEFQDSQHNKSVLCPKSIAGPKAAELICRHPIPVLATP